MRAESISNLITQASTLLFYGLTAFFAVYSLFVIYHWFAYGNSRSISLTATILYLGGGGMLLLIMALTLTQM